MLDCAFVYVCLFFPLTQVEPMKAYFCHGILRVKSNCDFISEF